MWRGRPRLRDRNQSRDPERSKSRATKNPPRSNRRTSHRASRGAAPECSPRRKPGEQNRKTSSSGGAKDEPQSPHPIRTATTLAKRNRRQHPAANLSPIPTMARNQKARSLHRRRHARQLAQPPHRLQRRRPDPVQAPTTISIKSSFRERSAKPPTKELSFRAQRGICCSPGTRKMQISIPAINAEIRLTTSTRFFQ
jgi:hypothetical protein